MWDQHLSYWTFASSMVECKGNTIKLVKGIELVIFDVEVSVQSLLENFPVPLYLKLKKVTGPQQKLPVQILM